MFERSLKRCNDLKKLRMMPYALELVKEEAVRRCPIDTGKLRKSARVKMRGNTGSISFGDDLEIYYAIYVHERLDLHHPVGEAKFLEKAWNVKKNEFLQALLER
jgi:hypothetical protein